VSMPTAEERQQAIELVKEVLRQGTSGHTETEIEQVATDMVDQAIKDGQDGD
jgi:uncharacterized protein YoaH (UPF0181 family)